MRARRVARIGTALAACMLAACGLLSCDGGQAARPPAQVAPDEPLVWVPPSLAARAQPERSRSLDAWRALLPELAGLPAVTTLSGVAKGASVVVADGRYMTTAELSELERFIESGGAAVLAGWVAVRAGAGFDAGVARMRDFLRVPRIATLGKAEAFFVAAGARGPLVAGTDPGERIELGWEPQIPALPGAASELYWAQWRLSPVGADAGASLRAERGRGRLVWLAPTPEAALVSEESRAGYARLMRAALGWAAKRPVVEILAWPRGAPLAAMLAMDTEEGFPAAGRAADVFESIRFPLTFFVLASEAERHRDVLARIARGGEIQSHAERHVGFEGVAAAEQLARLREARSALARLGAPSPIAFRPPYESFDAETVRAASAAGFTIFVADKEHRSAVPRLVEGSTLLQLPRGVADDFEIFERQHLSALADVLRVTQSDLEHMHAIGGLYYFSFHTQFFGSEDRLEALEALALAARAHGAWETTPSALERHWRARAACSVSATQLDASTLRIEVRNAGPEPATELALRVHAQQALRSAAVTATHGARDEPELRAQPGNEHFDLVLRELPPAGAQTLTVTFGAR
jgi:peptidoglycan/xylan/chitin deacetylase (PgdA/CDA1 family)